MTTYFALLVFGPPAVGIAVYAVWLAFARPTLLQTVRSNFTRENLAYVDPSFVPSFDARTRRSQRARAVFLLSLATTLLVMLPRSLSISPILVIAPLSAVAVSLESAERLWGAGREFVVPASRGAVARPRRVVLSDYVPVSGQLLTWGSVVLVLVTGTEVLGRRQEIGAAAYFVAAGAAALLAVAVFTAWFGRALCARPTPAVDASHLYLQDAWRGQALGQIHTTLRLDGLLFAMAALTSSNTEAPPPFSLAVLAAAMAIMVAALALPTRHFRSRLWNTLPPGQVLLPGQPVPPRVGASA